MTKFPSLEPVRHGNLITLLIIVIIGMTPVLWFKGVAINGTDVDFALFAQERLFSRMQLWDPNFMGGTPRSNNVSSLGFVAFSGVLEAVGITSWNQVIFYCALQLMIGLAMFFFLTATFPGRNTAPDIIAKTSACIFYMINFYVMFVWVRLQLGLTYLIFIPVFLGLIELYINRRIASITLVSLSCLLAFPSSPLGLQPPIIMNISVFFLLYACFKLWSAEDNAARWQIFRAFMLASLGFVMGSLFWAYSLLSFIFEAGYDNSAIGKSIYNIHSLIEWTSSITSTNNIIRFLGDVDWLGSWNNNDYYPAFIKFFEGVIAQIILYGLFAFILVALFERSAEYRRVTNFYFGTFVLFLFFSKGSAYPLGSIYLWMVDTVPLFWIQRAPWQKFTLISVFCFTILLYLSARYSLARLAQLEGFWSKLQSGRPAMIFALCLVPVVVLLGSHHLYVSGSMFRDGASGVGYHGKNRLGFHIDYPDYIFDARQKVQERDPQSIMLLPASRSNIFTWKYAGSTPVSVQLFRRGLYFKNYGEGLIPANRSQRLFKLATQQIEQNNASAFVDLMSIMGIDVILQRNDLRINFFNQTPLTPKNMKNFLATLPGAEKVTTGRWDLYFLKPERVRAMIYSPMAARMGNETLDANLLQILDGSYSPEGAKTVLLSSTARNRETLDTLRAFNADLRASIDGSSVINHQTISHSKYRVSFVSSNDQLPIVLNTNYSSQWTIRAATRAEGEAYQSHPKLFDITLPFITRLYHQFREGYLSQRYTMTASHRPPTIVNYFSNGWVVDLDDLCRQPDAECWRDDAGGWHGDLIIEYAPQKIFDALFMITFCLYGIALLALMLRGAVFYLGAMRYRSAHD